MTRVTACYGPPGTGKTFFCVNEVRRYLATPESSPQRIVFVSFTRKAAYEARERVKQEFGFEDDDMPYFCTLHSLAYRMAGLSRFDVMNDFTWKQFAKETGFDIRRTDHSSIDEGEFEGDDELLHIYNVARAKMISPEEEWQTGRYTRPLWQVRNFVSKLTLYKQRNGLVDFSDFLDIAMKASPPAADIVIIDEAQDLTPHQWLFARHIAGDAARVILAGDDDQAIYEWNGADPKQMRRFKANIVILPQSFRVPCAVQRFAKETIEQVRDRQYKEWRPREEEGTVSFLENLDDVSIEPSSGSWYLLARHRRALKALEQAARKSGVVYFKDGTWSNQHRSVRAVRSYLTLIRGRSVSFMDAKLVSEFIPDMSPPPAGYQTLVYSDLSWPWGAAPPLPWWQALRRMSGEDIAYLRGITARGESLDAPGKVVINTVHGVKGGQADNVVLFGPTTKRIQAEETINPDAETRVRYVGITRAKQNLYVLPGYFA